MNRHLQLVALCLVTLLALPPALAGELCRVAQGWRQRNAMACCADSTGGSAANATEPGNTPAPITQAQSCGEGCCSVSPQSTPQPGAPEKATSVLAPLADCTNTITAVEPEPAKLTGRDSRPDATPPDRQVLLQVFRI